VRAPHITNLCGMWLQELLHTNKFAINHYVLRFS
jgi:hypothetical protein